MMKRKNMITVCILAAFIILGVCSAYAADKLTGKVKDVDLDEQSVVVGGPGGDIVVYMEGSSKILKGGQAKTLKDIKVGSVIEVNFVKSGADKVVQRIVISP